MTYFSTSVVLLNKNFDSLTVYVDYCCMIKLSLWLFMSTIVVWKNVGCSCRQMMSNNDVESFDCLCRQVWFEKLSTVHVAKYCLLMMSTLLTVYVDKCCLIKLSPWQFWQAVSFLRMNGDQFWLGAHERNYNLRAQHSAHWRTFFMRVVLCVSLFVYQKIDCKKELLIKTL